MTTGLTTLLSLALPVEGELDGSWGDVVNYGITDYLDIAVAGTLTLTGDGAVTLANTTGDALATNITANATLAGAGTATAQFAAVRVSGTTTTKVVTFGSSGFSPYSKTYLVDNASSYTVTFKAYGQTGVSIAAAEKCTVYYNGTDIVKVASSVSDGVTSVAGTGNVNGITLTGTVTSTGNLTLGGTLSGVNLASQVTGTLPILNGGTGTTSTTFANLTTNVTGTLPIANGGTGTTSTTFANLTTNVTGTLPILNGGTGSTTANLTAGSGVTISGTWPNQTIAATGSGGTITSVTASSPLASSGGTTPNISFTGTLPVANGGTGVTTSTGTGSVVLSASPTFTGTPLAPTAANGTSTTQLATTAFVLNQIGAIAAGVSSFSAGTTGLTPATAQSGAITLAGTLAVANGGTGTASPALVQGTGISITGAWPNQTIAATNSGTVTSVTGTAPVVSSGGATPAISMAAATASVNGYMTSTFAAKLDGIAAGATNVTNTNQLTNGAGFITGSGNTTGSAGSLVTTNFSIVESGGALLIKYGATTVLSISSAGAVISASNVTAYGTP